MTAELRRTRHLRSVTAEWRRRQWPELAVCVAKMSELDQAELAAVRRVMRMNRGLLEIYDYDRVCAIARRLQAADGGGA